MSVDHSGFSWGVSTAFPFDEDEPGLESDSVTELSSVTKLECGRILDYYPFDLCGSDGWNEDQFRVVRVYHARLELTEFSIMRERQETLVVCGRIVTKGSGGGKGQGVLTFG